MDEQAFANKILAIFISLGILGYALVLKHKAQSWVSPGVIFSIFWFLVTFLPLTIVFNAPINPWSVLFIAICVFIFGLPGFSSALRTPLVNNIETKKNTQENYSGAFLSLSFFTIQLITILCILINLSIQGLSLSEFFSDVSGTANYYLNLRYSGKIESNIFLQLGGLLNYTGVCIGGLILGNKQGNLKRASILLLSFLPAILYMIMYADKGTLFLSAAFFYGGIIINRLRKGDTALTNKSTNKILILTLPILLIALTSSFIARGIDARDTGLLLSKLGYYFSSYALAHLYAFSDWFSSYNSESSVKIYEHSEDLTLGFSTFMAIFRAFGDLRPIPEGYYNEYFQYKDILKTNIFTMFRGTIQDFGIIGTFLYMLITGTIFNIAYITLLTARNPVVSVAIYICGIGYIYTSFMLSIMVWNSIFVLLITLTFMLYINELYQNIQAKKLHPANLSPQNSTHSLKNLHKPKFWNAISKDDRMSD
ncbi:O-antigen polymerase [Pseudomonas vanderleydeniana]|uniref:Oligosaccharide repeat unit polymerase n=1 Tax=Pseudomonas vanderleydeniana TaxID=2745495 RepID=A0A9E6PNT7_9PSED|nr:O-antigen polymerase [Pseudomonas vanderleydeniana]QXI30232.1 oligosaccharide repeat unit polymerase [Pseudomonas vanderleydeniana]